MTSTSSKPRKRTTVGAVAIPVAIPVAVAVVVSLLPRAVSSPMRGWGWRSAGSSRLRARALADVVRRNQDGHAGEPQHQTCVLCT